MAVLAILAELGSKAKHRRALITISKSCRERDAVLASATIEVEVGHEQRSTTIDTLRPHAHRHRVAAAIVNVELNIRHDDTRILHSLRLTLKDDVVAAWIERER